ncbi:oxidoreductase [Fimbriimonas ginsengisoli Gsoil 348]|uniref:Oxidoreductase n=1 Tax=Fimbriimonas ginsengisoli Gsoil 348 TaxID=661478 RepID=A0A068NS79_FIMGI|nr:oxidoreductase [Fimbriimonas ginsengisoli Gsoil 348]
MTVDVAIVGGGLAGITTATLLKAEGKSVAVIESNRVAEGVSGFTTAKITSQHSIIYDRLIHSFGEQKARAYGDANQAAIEQIASLANTFGIDCDFRRSDAFVFTEKEEEVDSFRTEADSARRLGLPAEFLESVPLPFPVKGAVRFSGQASFHPRKYLVALAQRLPGEGSFIFENTRVTGLHGGEPCTVETERGNVYAGHVVVASHFPFNEKLFYALRMYQHRSYVLGLRLNGELPNGMFISTEPTHSIRPHFDEEGGLLLVGGEGHRTGEGGDTVARYRRLEQWATDHFPVRTIEYRWSTQDNKTADGLPYIGRLMPTSEHVFVATGFGGWGMTNSTVSGMLLRDLILGRENPWADVYDPNRMGLEAVSGSAKHIGSVASHFVGDRHADGEIASLRPGEGMIVHSDEGKVAAYRAEDGSIHKLSPACPHMGCFVQWNSAEKSWDCPCHGSRFSIEGEVLEGPAISPLKEFGES